MMCIVKSEWELGIKGVKLLFSLQMGPFVDATHKLVKVSTGKQLRFLDCVINLTPNIE